MSEVKRWYVDEWSACREANDGPFVKYGDHAALAERLKSCEAERAELNNRFYRGDNSPIVLLLQIATLTRINDQLTADLANLNAMHQQLAAVLHDDDMPTFAPVANVVEDVMRLRADLDRARAEVETWKRRKDRWERAYRGYDSPEEECAKLGQVQTASHLKDASANEPLQAEVDRLRRVMEDAASAPGIDWLFWQLELGKALKETP